MHTTPHLEEPFHARDANTSTTPLDCNDQGVSAIELTPTCIVVFDLDHQLGFFLYYLMPHTRPSDGRHCPGQGAMGCGPAAARRVSQRRVGLKRSVTRTVESLLRHLAKRPRMCRHRGGLHGQWQRRGVSSDL